MGILRHHLDILFEETSKNNFIKGEVLTLGQQAVYLTLDQVYKLAAKHKGLKLSTLPENFDIKNKIPRWFGTKYDSNTNAQSIFKLLGAEKISVCDVSEYENPDFLINLNDPIDSRFFNKFDVIFDCGTLEHVFDFPTALWNLVLMLKTDGVLYLALPSSNAIDHGFYSISPGLFFDYFNANGFEVLGCYLRESSPLFYEKVGRLYKYKQIGGEIPIISSTWLETICLAKKIKSVSKVVKPIQTIYKNMDFWDSKKAPKYSLTNTKKLTATVFNLLVLIQNFLPNWFEIIIAKVRNKIGKNNIIFIKRI